VRLQLDTGNLAMAGRDPRVGADSATAVVVTGMFGLGAAVDLRAVLRSGGRSLAVAATGSALLVVLVTAGLFLVT